MLGLLLFVLVVYPKLGIKRKEWVEGDRLPFWVGFCKATMISDRSLFTCDL